MLHQAGVGVVGPVFRAHDPAGDRLVAVKSITLDMLPETTAELSRELRRLAGAHIDHPAAVPIFDAGVEAGRPFAIADFVAGESLDIARRHLAPATLETTLRMLEEIAGAVDAAWRAGVGHGALHPRDIFIVPATPAVRVTGFGIAQALERVRLNAPVRRPYTAPERDERRWDVRADVYTLGVIAQELLARRTTSDDPENAMPAVPRDLRAEVREVLSRAQAIDPAGRFESATAFVRALGAVGVGHQTSPAAAPSVGPASDITGGRAPLEQHADGAAVTFVAAPVPPPPAVSPPLAEPTAPADVISIRPPQKLTPVVDDRVDVSPDLFRGAARPQPRRAERTAYPWMALIAVAAAGLTAGAAGGYAVGRQIAVPAAAPPQAQAAPSEGTDVAVVPDPAPPPMPPVSEARPAVRTTTVGPGRVVVRSIPAGALVTVNGRHAGETPTTVSDLPFGTHSVLIARPGYVPRTERVTLSMRDSVRQLTVELRPGVSAGPASLGSVFVDSRPRGARVSIDGRFFGMTPISVPELSAGEHRVELDLEGHLSQTSTVQVRPGEQARVLLMMGREVRR